VTGLSIGRFFASEVAEPLGASFFIGLPADRASLLATVSCDEGFDSDEANEAFNAGTSAGRSMLWGPERRLGEVIRSTFNDPAFASAELAAAGPVTDARSLARIYGALACGGELDDVRLVSPESIERFRAPQLRATDVCWLQEYNQAMGYLLGHSPRYSWGPNPEAFGHHGLGGATAFADPVANVGFCYVPNRFRFGADVDARAQALIDALYACIS
jgi:CubicO group peptidase (beta-lactamase class C family)